MNFFLFYPYFLFMFLYKKIKFIYRKIFSTHEAQRAVKANNFKWFLNSIIYSKVFYNSNDKIKKLSLIQSTENKQFSNLFEEEGELIYYVNNIRDFYLKNKKFSKLAEQEINNYFYSYFTLLILPRILINKKTSTRFDDKQNDHNVLLKKLWNVTYAKIDDIEQKNQEINLIDDRWLFIGFQFKDPTQDFRSTGIYGLHQLVEFTSSKYFDKVYKTSTNKEKWYFFAAAGINITGHLRNFVLTSKFNDILLKLAHKSLPYEKIFKSMLEKEYETSKPLEQKFFKYLQIVYDEVFNNFNEDWLTQKEFNFMNFNSRLENFMKLRLESICNHCLYKTLEEKFF